MKILLDVSVLVALVFKNHVHHAPARHWLAGKTPVLCPLTELGFIRVALSPAHHATMDEARRALADFYTDEAAEFLPADLPALEGKPAPSAAKSTDWYLGNLADEHGLKWATLDKQANHPARELVA